MPALKGSLGLFVVFGFLSLLVATPNYVFSFFSDDFSDTTINQDVWQLYNNSGFISENGGRLSLIRASTESKSFPYIFAKTNIFPESGSFSINVKYRYLTSGNFGSGITISTDSFPENGVDPGSNIPGYITFSIWQSAPLGLYSQKVLCNLDGSKCNQLEFLNSFTTVSDLADHEFRIDYLESGQYKIFFDGDDSPRYVSGLNQKRPKKIWIGNPFSTSTFDYWSSFEIDYIHVNKIIEESVIILPGFGGSWDIGAILSGNEGSNWAIPSFVNNYDGILQSFRNAGYVDDTDLFVFPYDWRKPLTNLADDLKIFIDEKVPTGKVNLIGHSMGGLVARSYGQKHGVSKIDKILTAGSPHLGVIDMYGLWEGAMIWDGAWWQNVLLEIATEVNREQNETKVAAIRRVAPSIIDLFPTFSFLISGGSLIEIDSMAQKNSYLKTLNQDVGMLEDKLTPYWSEDVSTTRNTIDTVARSGNDILEQKWEDGKPIEGDPFGKIIGDGTVTKVSAMGPFGAGEKMIGWHGDLLANLDNNKIILSKLGLDPSFAVSSTTDSRMKSFVAILRSPGTLEVCDKLLINCNDELGLYFPEFKLFILPGYEDEDLSVKVKESGLGNYTLHVGKVENEGLWSRAMGNLESVGQVDKYLVTGSDMTINRVNDPPILNNIGNKSIDELTTLSFTATATDTDSTGLNFSLVDPPTGATIDQNTGDFSFTPTEAQGPGIYTFSVNASDGNSTDSEEITITVNEVNILPTADDISVSTNEDTSREISLTATDTDLPKNTLIYSILSSPSHGTVSLSGDLATYTPTENYHGTDSFTFNIRDSQAFDPLLNNPLGIGAVSVTVNSINDAPVANDVSASTGQEVAITIDLTGSDIEGNLLTYSIVSNGVHGTLGGISGNHVTYSPNGGFSGTDSFTFKINDGSADSNLATVNIKIDPPPQISDEIVNTTSETGATIVWNTNHPSTSRVIYDTVSHISLGTTPNYGYANSTEEKDGSPKVTSHTVIIAGLEPGTTYYYRVISHGSPEVVGSEKSFTTKGSRPANTFENDLVKMVKNITEEVLGETTEATPSPTPIITMINPSSQVLGEKQDPNDNLSWWWLAVLSILIYIGIRRKLRNEGH